jgi:hypothetical protein
MRKVDYLADPDVQAFIKDFRNLLNDEVDSDCMPRSVTNGASPRANRTAGSGSVRALKPFHKYQHLRPQYFWQCAGLLDALAKYKFKLVPSMLPLVVPAHVTPSGDSLIENADVLDHLSATLSSAHAAADNARAAAAAIAIQVWGGTTNKNVQAIKDLNAMPGGLCAYLTACKRSFGLGLHFDETVFPTTPFTLRSNAGFTKIYSLLFPQHFTIYDSRVAAALGMLIVRSCANRSLPGVPAALNLGWSTGRSGVLRNPSVGRYTQRGLNGTGRNAWLKHMRSNIRANWLIGAAVAGTSFERAVITNPTRFPVTPVRGLEAALFMIGYTLAGNPSIAAHPDYAVAVKPPSNSFAVATTAELVA